MATLIHVGLGRWPLLVNDLDAMGFLKDKINRADLAADLEREVTALWPLAGSFDAESFLADGSAREGGALAARIQDGSVNPELGLGQGLSFGKLAKVRRWLVAFSCVLVAFCHLSMAVAWGLSDVLLLGMLSALTADNSFLIIVCSHRTDPHAMHTTTLGASQLAFAFLKVYIAYQTPPLHTVIEMCSRVPLARCPVLPSITFWWLQVIIKLAIKHRFNLPAYYTLVVRSLGSLEGIALRVDPNFSIVNTAIPIILRRLLTDTRRGAIELLRELLLEDGTQRLRVGMLEGLLSNYSAEAGAAGAAAGTGASPAAGVVLKGAAAATEATAGTAEAAHADPAPRAVRAGTRSGGSVQSTAGIIAAAQGEAAPSGTSTAVAQREQWQARGNGSPAHGARAGNGAYDSEPGSNGLRGASGAHSNGVHRHISSAPASAAPAAANGQHMPRSDTLTTVDEADQAASSTQSTSQPGTIAAAAADTSTGDADKPAEASAAAAAVAAAPPPSLELQVLTMALSAKAAGVRRVLLEADMKVWRQMCFCMELPACSASVIYRQNGSNLARRPAFGIQEHSVLVHGYLMHLLCAMAGSCPTHSSGP